MRSGVRAVLPASGADGVQSASDVTGPEWPLKSLSVLPV
jgi:hypothetical protein